jgi:hypothetical protein
MNEEKVRLLGRRRASQGECVVVKESYFIVLVMFFQLGRGCVGISAVKVHGGKLGA